MTDIAARRLFNDVLRLAGVAILFYGAFILYRRLGLSAGWSLFFAMMVVPVVVVIATTLWRLATHKSPITTLFAGYPKDGD